MQFFLRQIPKLFVVSSISLALVAGNAYADTPDNLTDIPYQSTEWGSEQLRFRGYTLVHSDQDYEKTWEYWWQGSSNTCIQARAAEGKYEAIQVTSGTDCNQYHQEAVKGSSAAAVAVAAAALIGVAVLAHKSHDREDKHGKDEKSMAEFERGYRDGLHHERYHNYRNTQAYSDGYNRGQRERDEQTSHHSHTGRHSGYHPYVSVNDLVGARASSADSELSSRGFATRGGHKQDNKSFVTWYNAATRQCIQTVTKEGRIARIDSLVEGNCL